MSKVTQNAILILAAAAATTQVFATVTKEGNKIISTTFALADGTPVEEKDVVEFKITDAASVAVYNELFNKMPVEKKSGYFNYVNDAGLTNSQVAKTFSPQGIAKIMAQLIEAAHIIIGSGEKAQADEMKLVLDATLGYSAVAAANIAQQKAQKIADDMRTAAASMTPEQRAALIASLSDGGNTVPTATVAPNETGEHADHDGKGSKGKGSKAHANAH